MFEVKRAFYRYIQSMTPEEFQTQFQKGWSLRNDGRYEEANTLAQEHRRLAQEASDQASEALFVKLTAQVYSDQGALRDALKNYKLLERIYIGLEDKPKQMHALRHIGMLFHELGEHECAQKCLIQVVEAYETQPPAALEIANTHRLYALALEGLEKMDEAKTYWQKAKTVYEQLWIPEGVEECDEHLA